MKEIHGKELEKLMEDLARENFKTYKKYDFAKVSKLLEDEVKFSHQFAYNKQAGKCQFNKYKKHQSSTTYILNLQLMINQNINYASWGHSSSFNIIRRDVNYELMINSLGQIIPSYTIRTNYRDGEYNVLAYCVDRNGDSISLQNRKNIVKKKITIKDGFFDVKSVLEASDEVLALAGEKRYGNVMSIDMHDEKYLEIHQEF
tara:strand:+ start:2530 stop:3135 length:606 start_codon:yes stop_codon:yes gene_type:complete